MIVSLYHHSVCVFLVKSDLDVIIVHGCVTVRAH